MLVSVYIFEQQGQFSGIFSLKIDPDDVEAFILDIFRRDNSCGLEVKNPSKPLSETKFFYTPFMNKQFIAENLPFNKNDTFEIIDMFTCIGTRFDLDSLQVVVEVCRSKMGEKRYWANIYYVADSEIPACIIKVRKQTAEVSDHKIQNYLFKRN